MLRNLLELYSAKVISVCGTRRIKARPYKLPVLKKNIRHAQLAEVLKSHTQVSPGEHFLFFTQNRFAKNRIYPQIFFSKKSPIDSIHAAKQPAATSSLLHLSPTHPQPFIHSPTTSPHPPTPQQHPPPTQSHAPSHSHPAQSD